MRSVCFKVPSFRNQHQFAISKAEEIMPRTDRNQPLSVHAPPVTGSATLLPVDFVIITPLEEERKAILAKLPGYQRLNPSENDIWVYYTADLPVTFPDN